MMKILILQMGGGDELLLSTPVMRCLKNQLDVELHVLVTPGNRFLIEHNPNPDFIHLNDEGSVTQLKDVAFDYIVDLQNNSSSENIRKLFGARTVTYMRYPVQEFFAGHFGMKLSRRHIVEKYFDAVANINVYDDGAGADYVIGQLDHIKLHKDIPTSHQAGYIAIAMDNLTVSNRKKVKLIQEYCSNVNYPVILVGGKNEYDLAKTISNSAPGNVYNACVKFTSGESIDILKHAKTVIALPDSIMVHLGAALKKKLIIPGAERTVRHAPFYGSQFLARSPHPFAYFPGSDVKELVKLTNRFLKPV